MYEEENLMYQLDQFDNVISTVDNETRSTENAPLISPQKTLIDKPLLPPPRLVQSDDESSRLAIIPEESSHKSADIDRNDVRNAQFASKQQSNPFLYNEQLCDIYANVLPVQSIIRMWRSNLELQIPIIKYYNNHLSRVSARTKNVPKEMIAWVEGATNNLITALNALEHIVSNIDNVHSTTASAFDNSDKMYSVPTFNDYGKHVHAFNTLSSSMNAFCTGEFYGHMQNTAHDCHRTQPVLTDTGHISQNPFDDTRHGQAAFLKANIRLNGTVLSPYDNWPNDTCSFNNNDLGLSDIAMRVQALAVDANIHDANHDNSDINGGIDFSESTSVESTPVRKETNPFKIGFTVGDTASQNETQRRAVPAPIASPKKSRTVRRLEPNCSRQETRGNLSDVPRYELFAGKCEVNLNENECPARVDPCNIFPFDNKPSKSKRSLFSATEEPADDNRNVSRSYFSCDDASSLLGIRQSPNTNVPILSQTPFTASTLPLSADNLNCDDEGYLTRPPTSDTLGSSPPLGLINEVESSERPVTTDASQPSSISAEAWIKAIESTIAMNSPSSKRCDDALTSNIAECVNSESIPLKFGNPANSFNFAHTGANGHSGNLIELTNSVCKDSNDEDEQTKRTKLNKKEEIIESNAYLEDTSLTISSTEQLFFQSVELTNGSMYVFHFEENGWLSIDEFTETFTEFRTPSSIMAMKSMDVELSLKELNRQDYPSAFAELDSSSLRASRDSEHRIRKISMISLRSGLKVLVSLKVIDPKDYNEGKFEKGSPLYEIKTLTSAYKDLKRRLKENQS